MARKSRRRYYRRKGKWSANISKLENTQLTASSGTWSTYTTLAVNPAQTNSTVSQQYTIKNLEMTFQLESSNTPINLEAITVYIMYVPQGMNVGDDYYLQHPEYIMAYRFIGSPEYEMTGTNLSGIRNPLKVRTRLARRLHTGDSIIAYFEGVNTGTSSLTLDVNGLIRWWSTAN